jgi:hypothetical protein
LGISWYGGAVDPSKAIQSAHCAHEHEVDTHGGLTMVCRIVVVNITHVHPGIPFCSYVLVTKGSIPGHHGASWSLVKSSQGTSRCMCSKADSNSCGLMIRRLGQRWLGDTQA